MSAILIRGLSPKIRRWLQKMASKENLSLNQTIIKLVIRAKDQSEEAEEKERRRKEAFRRIDELRAELHEKYGKFDDSTKIIREMRDSRYR